MQSVTEEVVRVISHADFRQFIHGLISDSGPRFRAIVEGSQAYQASKVAITKRLIEDFDQLSEAVAQCVQCRDVHQFDLDFDFEVFKAEHDDLESIKAKLEAFAEWEVKIKNNIKQHDRGLVNASTAELRGRLTKRVKTEQRAMKEYLRELADSKARESTQGLQEIQSKMKEGLSSLAGYVAYVDELRACRGRLKQIGDQKKQLDDMRAVL